MNSDIVALIEVSFQRHLTSPEETRLLRLLKPFPENEVFEVLKQMIEKRSRVTISFFRRAIRSKYYVAEVFRFALLSYGAKSIKVWLEFAIPKLGFAGVVVLIRELNDDYNDLLGIALYYLPSFISTDELKAQSILNDLRSEVQAKSSSPERFDQN
jgi:hypothetical protein